MFYHSFLNLFWLPAAWTELHVEGAITDSGGETLQGFPGGSVAQNPSASAGDTGDMGLIPGLGRSGGEGNGNPLQHSRLESPMGRGAWWAAVRGVAKSHTTEQLSTQAHETQQLSLSHEVSTVLEWTRMRTRLNEDWQSTRPEVWIKAKQLLFKLWQCWGYFTQSKTHSPSHFS